MKKTDFWGNKPKLTCSDKERKSCCLRPLFVKDETDIKIAQVILNYFNAVRKMWPNSWNGVIDNNILNKTTGYIALMKLFKDLYLNIDKEIPTTDDFYSLLAKVQIKDGDFSRDSYAPGGTGEGKLYQELRKSIFDT